MKLSKEMRAALILSAAILAAAVLAAVLIRSGALQSAAEPAPTAAAAVPTPTAAPAPATTPQPTPAPLVCDGPLELPVQGATGYAATGIPLYAAPCEQNFHSKPTSFLTNLRRRPAGKRQPEEPIPAKPGTLPARRPQVFSTFALREMFSKMPICPSSISSAVPP